MSRRQQITRALRSSGKLQAPRGAERAQAIMLARLGQIAQRRNAELTSEREARAHMLDQSEEVADWSPVTQPTMTLCDAQRMTATDFERFRATVEKVEGRPVSRDEIMQALRDAEG